MLIASIVLASICISGLVYLPVTELQFSFSYPRVNVRVINGFIISLALLELIFQVVAIVWLFADIAFLNIKIPLGKTTWYLFNIIVSITITGIGNSIINNTI